MLPAFHTRDLQMKEERVETCGQVPIAVVAAVIWDKDRFLACQRPESKARGGLWEFVGGKVEPGETKTQALVRECREELGITISVEEPFLELTHRYPDLTIQLTVFHASVAEGTPRLLEHQAFAPLFGLYFACLRRLMMAS